MFGFLKKKVEQPASILEVDIHSHLIPGVDDGVQSFEESLALIKGFEEKGYKKLITTPHIMADFYDNSETHLKEIVNDLMQKVLENNISINIEVAAEYYLDDRLNERISDPKEEFLTFGNNYLLFETSFMNEPLYLKEFIFNAKSRGLNPVLAHPERYHYLISNNSLVEELANREVLFQLNINSLSGYYSKQVKKFAEKLIDAGSIHFAGSDCHNQLHFENLSKAKSTKYYNKLLSLPLKNNSL